MPALQFATATANLASQNAFLFLATHGPIFIASSSSATLIQCCVESGISLAGSIREYQESRLGMGVSGVPDIRESGPTGYPGYLRDIRDIRNQDQGWGYQVLSLISLIQHRFDSNLPTARPRHGILDLEVCRGCGKLFV